MMGTPWTRAVLRRFFESMLGGINKLMVSKNEDYAEEDNVFLNFETVAAANEIYDVNTHTPKGEIEDKILMKIDRMFRVGRRVDAPNNESLEDTVKDLIVFALLYLARCMYEGELSRKSILQQTAKEEDNAD